MTTKYEDERIDELEQEKQQALDDSSAVYDDLRNQMDDQAKQQQQAWDQYKEEQIKNQQERTDFTIQQIEQQKEQAKKDYQKEQSAAYTDWQKQSNQYGVNAEKIAANGLAGTGFSESSQVQMYNTYQMRVAAAKQSIDQIMVSYNNAITEARLQNNAALAQIAWETLQQQMALQMQAFQFNADLTLQEHSERQAIDDKYYGRMQDLLALIESENAGGSGGTVYVTPPTGPEIDPNLKLGGGEGTLADYNIDPKSVAQLGMGQLTVDQLVALVENGEIDYYTENGVTYFFKTNQEKKPNNGNIKTERQGQRL